MLFAPVVRTRSAAPLRSFDRSFERFVNDAFLGATSASGFQLEQDDKAWTITLDLPGVAREDLSIQVEGPYVRVETRPEAKRQYKAAWELPEEIDADATSAKLEHGVLTLSLAKKAPVSHARQITIA
jgi:HSP20 family protein